MVGERKSAWQHLAAFGIGAAIAAFVAGNMDKSKVQANFGIYIPVGTRGHKKIGIFGSVSGYCELG
jgi:hypothetical protein